MSTLDKILDLVKTKGFFSSENFRGYLLHGLAFYALYKGLSPDDVSNVLDSLADKAAQYKDILIMIAAFIGPTIDNIFYTQNRTKLKMESMKNESK